MSYPIINPVYKKYQKVFNIPNNGQALLLVAMIPGFIGPKFCAGETDYFSHPPVEKVQGCAHTSFSRIASEVQERNRHRSGSLRGFLKVFFVESKAA